MTLVLEIDGQRLRRNHSLSDAPHGRWYRITLKREEGGQVSTWLHDHVEAGALLRVQPPAGEFILDDRAQRPLLLVTDGVGITPAICAWAGARRARAATPLRVLRPCRGTDRGLMHEALRHQAGRACVTI